MGWRGLRGATAALAVVAASAAVGCGDDDDQPEAAGATSTAVSTASSKPAAAETPLDAAVVEAARKEGSVLLYTNANDEQTAPIIKAFRKKHPGIKVRTLSLNGDEVIQRYLSESASGGTTADMIMVSNAVGWRTLAERGAIEDYEDPNVANLPPYAKLGDGIVAVSVDPMIAFFNNAVLPESRQPETLADLAKMAGELKGKVATTDVATTPQAFESTAAYLGKQGEAGWRVLEQLGKSAKVESSTGSLVTKLAQGQYAAAFFVPGSVRPLLPDDVAKILNWKYLTDATVAVPRGIGILEDAKSPNAAKVLLNFLLSVEGQQAACEGGITPYRDGVDCEFGFPDATAALGEDAVAVGSYGAQLAEQRPVVVDRWKAAFGR